MNVAKTAYRAALVAAALSCFGLALPAHADDRDSRYSREHRERSHDPRWSPPGHRYRGDYRHDYRHDYRPDYGHDSRRDYRHEYRRDYRHEYRRGHGHDYRGGHWRDRPWDRRYDRWRHHDRHWRGGHYDRRHYDRGWYGSSHRGYERYPRGAYDDYDGDVELRIRIPF